jgi:hypothetical protein
LNLSALLLVLLLCALLALRLSRRKNAWRKADVPWPFYAKRPLASPAQVLYHRLVSALPGHIVLSGVELSGVLGVRRGMDAQPWNRRIRGLHYDFVVCSKDATVLAAIALDDTPHGARDGTQADLIKDRASAAAGVRLLRWPAKALPDLAAIQEALGELQMPSFEEVASSANQSWWPPVAGEGRNLPPG